jgi:hypothetical protein
MGADLLNADSTAGELPKLRRFGETGSLEINR